MTEIKTKGNATVTGKGLVYRLSGTDVEHANCNLTMAELRAIELGSTVRINNNTYALIEKKENVCICGHPLIDTTVMPF